MANETSKPVTPIPTPVTYSVSKIRGAMEDGTTEEFILLQVGMVTGSTILFFGLDAAKTLGENILKQVEGPAPDLVVAREMPKNAAQAQAFLDKMRNGDQ